MAETHDIKDKSDADILTDLTAMVSNVEGFSWDSGNPRVVYTTSPSDADKAKVHAYFSTWDHKEDVSI